MTDVNTLVVEATGAVLTEQPWLVSHEDAENLVLHSNNLPNAAWLEWPNTTLSFDQVGLGGLPNTATLIEKPADTADLCGAYQDISVPVDTNTLTVVFYIKKDAVADRGVYCSVWNEGYAGKIERIVNINNGDSRPGAADFPADWDVEEVGDWLIVRGQFDNQSWATVTPDIVVGYEYASATPIQHPSIVGNIELYHGKTIEEVKALPGPIFTEGAAVTAGVTPQYQPENHSDTQGPYIIEFEYEGQDTSVLGGFLSIVGGQLQLTDGTNFVELPITPGYHKAGVAFGEDAGSMALNLDGAWSADETYDGSLPIGALLDQGITAREIKRYPHSDYLVQKARLDELMIPDAAIAVTHSSQYVTHESAYITHTED